MVAWCGWRLCLRLIVLCVCNSLFLLLFVNCALFGVFADGFAAVELFCLLVGLMVMRTC